MISDNIDNLFLFMDKHGLEFEDNQEPNPFGNPVAKYWELKSNELIKEYKRLEDKLSFDEKRHIVDHYINKKPFKNLSEADLDQIYIDSLESKKVCASKTPSEQCDKEVNKIIAEFMGYKLCEESGIMSGEKIVYKHSRQYTISLDSLVPVWEKLDELDKGNQLEYVAFDFYGDGRFFWFGEECDYESDYMYFKSEATTIQQAAAHATAKAILELKDER